MSKPRISIVTPSLNQAVFIERTIRSVIEQRGDFELEYLIFDGGSQDGTHAILDKYRGIAGITIETDRGQSDAINKGLRQVTGEIIGWLNSDDVLWPGALAKVAAAFQAAPDRQWVHGGCMMIDSHDHSMREWVMAYKSRRAKNFSLKKLLLENFVNQMTVFWRRSAMDQIGLLDPDLKYAFDYDYWLRLSRLGPPLYIPEVLAGFRMHGDSKSGAQFKKQFLEDFKVFRRHAPANDSLLYLRKAVRSALIVSTYQLMNMRLKISRPSQACAL
jgi:glycosyltransferase involved in cell wall biosynthesis